MAESILEKLFEHNNWANLRIIQACSVLSDNQLDAEPQSATMGSIRVTLIHIVAAQRNYLSLLTRPVEMRRHELLVFADLAKVVSLSGEGLLVLVRDPGKYPKGQLRTSDGYLVEPWVVLLQAINHANEHREQICSMLSAIGMTPPDLDGWSYGQATDALISISP